MKIVLDISYLGTRFVGWQVGRFTKGGFLHRHEKKYLVIDAITSTFKGVPNGS